MPEIKAFSTSKPPFGITLVYKENILSFFEETGFFRFLF